VVRELVRTSKSQDPPIHSTARTAHAGANNRPQCQKADDVGDTLETETGALKCQSPDGLLQQTHHGLLQQTHHVKSRCNLTFAVDISALPGLAADVSDLSISSGVRLQHRDRPDGFAAHWRAPMRFRMQKTSLGVR
jgi:hypothetical protein